jgi:hypothetical protein
MAQRLSAPQNGGKGVDIRTRRATVNAHTSETVGEAPKEFPGIAAPAWDALTVEISERGRQIRSRQE